MKFFVIFILFFTFLYFIMSKNYLENHPPSRGEQLVNSITAKAAKNIGEKYNLKASGFGVAMPGGPIKEVTLCFDTPYLLTKEKIRELLIKSAHELLNYINTNDEIQKFLMQSPFNINNVEIIIYNNDDNGRDVHDPEISTARISQGHLIYRTTQNSKTFKFKNRFEETYEEALKRSLNNMM